MQHLDSNKILYALQHGFRKNFSGDTQLLSLFQDLSSNPSQTDMIIMDFSKAFDKVPHIRLQYKLNWYGIRGSTHNWIQHVLQGRSQRVVSEGSQSSPILSSLVCPKVLFLARYYFLYTSTTSPTKPSIVQSVSLLMIASSTAASKPNAIPPFLQTDLNSIAQWELTWQMKFNIDKCYTMQVGRKMHKILNTYTLHDHPLPITDSAKYL